MRTMFDRRKFAERIRVAIARIGTDQKTAAREAGVTESTMSRAAASGSASVESYLRIEHWLARHERKTA